ncbi:MAG: glucokinase, partial [Caldilineae bacterium]
ILEAKDLHTLHPGRAQIRAPLAVVAPGTGLGEAFLLWDGHTYRAHPSEGGHASFAPVGEEQVDLLRYLLQHHSHVSYERVCSGGLGIPNLYRFFKETGRYPEPDWLAEELAEAPDPTPVIVQTALKRGEDAPICRAVVNAFLDILAGEAGNMVLKVMATGGVYLGGGLPPRLLEAFDAERFLAIFSGKGRFADLLRNVPVHIILNQKAALLGAARYGLEILSTER